MAGLDRALPQVVGPSENLSLESEEFLGRSKGFGLESSKTIKLLPKRAPSSLSLMRAIDSQNGSATKIKFEGELDFKIHIEDACKLVYETRQEMPDHRQSFPVRETNYSRKSVQIDSVVDLGQLLLKEKKFMDYVKKNGCQL